MTGPTRASRPVSFIITARNEYPSVLFATIEGLLATAGPHLREIVVVDDGSFVPVICPQSEVRLIRNAVPLGVSQSRRRGAELALGEVLVWLDAHMSFTPGWLDHMLKYVDCGAFLCSAFCDYDRKTRLCWGADFSWCGERDYGKQLYPGFGLRHRVYQPTHPLEDVPMAIGACYMMLRSSYLALGGFCPLFRNWGVDEQDISARAWMAGVGVKCVTSAQVGHMSRDTFPYEVRFEHLEYNQLAMVRSVFEESTIAAIESFFTPIPTTINGWLNESDLTEWRSIVQSNRMMSDREFFQRFMPDSPFSCQ